MELMRRHIFWFILGGIFIALLALEGWLTLSWQMDASRVENEIKSDEQKLARMGLKYNESVIEDMTKQLENTQKNYRDIIDYIKKLGAVRKPLTKGLFPIPPASDRAKTYDLLGRFKYDYGDKLKEFMKQLGAVDPENKETTREQLLEAQMFASSEKSFFRPTWLEGTGSPDTAQAIQGQENIWLMEDIVSAIRKVNDDFFNSADGQEKSRTALNAPIKQLIEIRIGNEFAQVEGTSTGGRYRRAAQKTRTKGAEAEVRRAQSLTGHASENPLYKVLPFRVVVIADNEFAGRLLRQLSGSESFITVEGVQITAVEREKLAPATKTKFEDLDVPKLYGSRGLVQMKIVGESLIFQLPGGRIITPGEKEAELIEDLSTPPPVDEVGDEKEPIESI